MKKIIVIILIFVSVLIIYLSTLDKKIYYLALGDSLAVGLNSDRTDDFGYTDYIKNHLENKNKLEIYVDQFAINGYRSIDLIRDIKDNKKIIVNDKKITLQNALVKADLITLSIGINDFYGLLDEIDSYDYINDAFIDIEELFKLLRYYSKEEIIVLGYYSPYNSSEEIDNKIKYANKKLQELCEEYNITYIDIYDLFKENDYLSPNNIHPNNKGYESISEKIINVVDTKMLN